MRPGSSASPASAAARPARWWYGGSTRLLLALALQLAMQRRHGGCGAAAVPVTTQRHIGSIPGDFIIGALFPVHQSPDAKNAQTRTCGEVSHPSRITVQPVCQTRPRKSEKQNRNVAGKFASRRRFFWKLVKLKTRLSEARLG